MPRVSDSAVSKNRSRLSRPFMLPSPYGRGRHTEVVISELHTWPVRTPVNASPASLRTPVHDSEPNDGSLVRLSHPLLHAGFIPALS